MRPMGKKMIYPIWLKPKQIVSAQKSHILTYDSLLDIERGLVDAKGKVIGGLTLDKLGELHDKYPSSVYGITEPEHEFYESMSRNDVTISNKF
jgi:hypothetical protein